MFVLIGGHCADPITNTGYQPISIRESEVVKQRGIVNIVLSSLEAGAKCEHQKKIREKAKQYNYFDGQVHLL